MGSVPRDKLFGVLLIAVLQSCTEMVLFAAASNAAVHGFYQVREEDWPEREKERKITGPSQGGCALMFTWELMPSCFLFC